MPADFFILTFPSQKHWRQWLKLNHTKVDGIWLRFHKKASKIPTVVYAEALDEALCYGWIDSQLKKYDELSYLQKFTPRRSRSMWSKVNRDKVQRLIDQKKMTASGLKEIERAKADGRWENAYASPGNAVIHDDFQAALDKNKKAKAFYETLNKHNRYAIYFRVQNAKKAETREQRIKQFVAQLSRGETILP